MWVCSEIVFAASPCSISPILPKLGTGTSTTRSLSTARFSSSRLGPANGGAVGELRPGDPRVDRDLTAQEALQLGRLTALGDLRGERGGLFARRVEEHGAGLERLLQSGKHLARPLSGLAVAAETAERQCQAGDVAALHRDVIEPEDDVLRQIGRASCRER